MCKCEDDATAWSAIRALPRRLATFLKGARTGLDDDAAVLAAVSAGRVLINSTAAISADDVVLPCDRVSVDGAVCELALGSDSVVYAYHKPAAMECDVRRWRPDRRKCCPAWSLLRFLGPQDRPESPPCRAMGFPESIKSFGFIKGFAQGGAAG